MVVYGVDNRLNLLVSPPLPRLEIDTSTVPSHQEARRRYLFSGLLVKSPEQFKYNRSTFSYHLFSCFAVKLEPFNPIVHPTGGTYCHVIDQGHVKPSAARVNIPGDNLLQPGQTAYIAVWLLNPHPGTDSSKQPIRTRYLGHMTGYQPIRDQIGKCGLGPFDFNCGLVWLVFIKIYKMAIYGTNRCRKAVVEVVGRSSRVFINFNLLIPSHRSVSGERRVSVTDSVTCESRVHSITPTSEEKLEMVGSVVVNNVGYYSVTLQDLNVTQLSLVSDRWIIQSLDCSIPLVVYPGASINIPFKAELTEQKSSYLSCVALGGGPLIRSAEDHVLDLYRRSDACYQSNRKVGNKEEGSDNTVYKMGMIVFWEGTVSEEGGRTRTLHAQHHTFVQAPLLPNPSQVIPPYLGI
eukprot:sb/3465266/